MTTTDFTRIKVAVDQRIATVTLAMPESSNALDNSMIAELSTALAAIQKHATAKVILLTGEGDSFCSGLSPGYLKKIASYDYAQHQEDSQSFMRLLSLIYAHRKPVIAAVRGNALGPGCGLVTVSDLVVASKETARFGFPEVRMGVIPGLVLLFLIRRVGEGRARALVLRGEPLTAEEARSIGLVNLVVPETSVEQTARELAQELAHNASSSSMSLIKELLSRTHGMSTADALEYAANLNALSRMTDDSKRGIDAGARNEALKW